jgi:hypothetical protein
MPSKGQMTGMQGVFLVAAELSRLGFIVSPTSRSAAGADLLVTDQICQKAWSVQVKTNSKNARFWLVGKHGSTLSSESHVYVFVTLKGIQRPEFIVAPSSYIKTKVRTLKRPNSTWWSFHREDRLHPGEADWLKVFGDPHLGKGPLVEGEPDQT